MTVCYHTRCGSWHSGVGSCVGVGGGVGGGGGGGVGGGSGDGCCCIFVIK